MRPQTYESEAEAKVLTYVYTGRSGLQNTSFALMSPDGKKVTRGSRSPKQTYGSAEKFAEALSELSKTYAEKAKTIEALPTLRDLRQALNVTAADLRPLIIVRGKNAAEAKKLQAQVATTAWSEDVIGVGHYVVLAEEVNYEGLKPELGITVVQADP